jgi:tetratricopeptide (TPR) repeat protein
MHRHFLGALPLLVTALLFSATPSARAQTVLTLPEASARARVTQRVGITDIAIDYHRPLVNGRPVWGKLVPYGQVWRAGADENTTIEFSDPVSIEGKALAKGIYGLHMIPGENEWTIIFSKNSTSWGSFSYDQAEDALRVTVKPQPAEFQEALTYDFDDLKPDSGVITLRWEKLAVPFQASVNVNEIVQQSLRNQMRGTPQFSWEGGDEAASYLADHNRSPEEALKYADGSIQAEERFENLVTKARILDQLGRKEEAVAARKKAMDMGSALQLHSYGRGRQFKGDQQGAFEVFRVNMKKHPNDWTAHSEAARLATAQGDFGKAVEEEKLAVAAAPDNVKQQLERMLKRLEAKEDINK